MMKYLIVLVLGLFLLNSCKNNQLVKFKKEKFSYIDLKSYDIRDWHYEERHSLLTQLTKDEIRFLYPEISKEELSFVENNYHFFSWNSSTEFTILIDDEVCCGLLHLIQLDTLGNKLSDEVVAGVGGDGGWNYYQFGEFINDTTYHYTIVNYETINDNDEFVEYKVDSTNYYCSYNIHSGLKKINEKRNEFKLKDYVNGGEESVTVLETNEYIDLELIDLPPNDKNEIISFINDFKSQIENVDSLISMIHFPLYGEWGFVLGFNNGGEDLSKADFRNGFHNIFTPYIKEQIDLNNFSFFKIENVDSEYDLLLNCSISKKSEFESSRLFRFKKINGEYKLYLIFHAG